MSGIASENQTKAPGTLATSAPPRTIFEPTGAPPIEVRGGGGANRGGFGGFHAHFP